MIGKYTIKVRVDKDHPEGKQKDKMDCNVGLDVFGMIKMEKCFLKQDYTEIKKIPVKKDIPKAPATTVDTKDKKKEGDEKATEQTSTENKSDMEDVANQQQPKDTEMGDATNKEEPKQEVKKEEVPVQEYEEVKKQKTREIECRYEQVEEIGRYASKTEKEDMKKIEEWMADKDRLAHENADTKNDLESKCYQQTRKVTVDERTKIPGE